MTNKLLGRGNSQLHLAAKEGDLVKFQSLLGKAHHRPDINAQNSSGKTPLCHAAKHGRVEIAATLAANPYVDPNLADKKGRTPLSYAAEKGHVEIVNALLVNPHIDINKADKHGRTPLSYAAEMKRFDLVNILLSAGADPNLPDDKGRTPLDYVAKHGHFETARTLIENEQTALNSKGRNGKAPLHRAMENNHGEIVRLLAAQTSRIDLDLTGKIGSKDSRTALTYAAGKGHSEFVQILLEAGADPNKPDGKGNAPLHRAVIKEHPETVNILLQQAPTIDLNLPDRSGNTALHIAVSRKRTDWERAIYIDHIVLPRDEKMVNALLSQAALGRGLNPNLGNSEGLTPLALAIKNGNFSLTELLRNSRAVDINIPNNNGETPFFLSIDYLSRYPGASYHDFTSKGVMQTLPCYKLLKDGRTMLGLPTNAGKTPFEHLLEIAKRQVPSEGLIPLSHQFLREMLKHSDALLVVPREKVAEAERLVRRGR